MHWKENQRFNIFLYINMNAWKQVSLKKNQIIYRDSGFQ